MIDIGTPFAEYTQQEAQAAFLRVAQQHGWSHNRSW